MIKILSAQQLKEADQFTIGNLPIKSIDLMEHAATAFCNWFKTLNNTDPVLVFCGPGNNGGDGLAIARLLSENKIQVSVFILKYEKYAVDFSENLKRLEGIKSIPIKYISSQNDFPSFEKIKSPVIIDALFGTGLNKPLKGVAAALIEFLNHQQTTGITVDIPSGLLADVYTAGISFEADYTFTFHAPKFSFLFTGNYEKVGEWKSADIGLEKGFIDSLPSNNYIIETIDVKNLVKPRKPIAHKGNFGHALIYAGGNGKMGAALLCTSACVRSGAGLTTTLVSNDEPHALNAYIPEAMTEVCKSASEVSDLDFTKYNAIAMGPGIGTDKSSEKILWSLIENGEGNFVFDADALNILSKEKDRRKLIPKNSILTPHRKEFERLEGKSKNWEERHNRQLELSVKHSIYIVLKGKYTCITTPDGKSYFNTTGNAGMAKGGSGDVLTGIIVSLLAQKYSPADACIIGVYLHGLAADIAVEKESIYSLTASDIIGNIGNAYQRVVH